MSNKFDLERFKAGEPAVDLGGTYMYYVGTLKNGKIVFEYDYDGTNRVLSISVDDMIEDWTMIPKEEWILLPKKFDTFKSKEEAENAFGKPEPEFFEAVKIIRE